MKLKAIAKSLKASVPSTESIIPPAPVEQTPTELPYAKEKDHFEQTGVTMEPVIIEELYEELEEALADVALDIESLENLAIISNLGSTNLGNAAMESFVCETMGLESGTRMLSATSTGGIKCTADVISLEELAGNAAKAGWDKVYRKILAIIDKAGKVSESTDEMGRRIQEQFRAVKKDAFSYRGGKSINIATMCGSEGDLAKVIANTRLAITEDLSGKSSAQLDRVVNDLTAKTASAIAAKKGALTDVATSGVKEADNLSSAFKIKDANFQILGFTRQTKDDQLTLAQGIIRTLTGSERAYSYTRYSPNKGGARREVELKPNVVKDLYSIGMNIGNEIAEQSRIWPQRLSALKDLADMAKAQGGSVDEDKNTWAAEQSATSNSLKMWNTNAAARKHYINVYNKMATEILQVLNHVTGAEVSTKEVSQELFGFSKPNELSLEQATKYIRSNLSKFKEGSVNADVSLLGGQAEVDNILKHVDAVIKPSSQLLVLAKEPFAKVYATIGKFEEDDDEDAMDDVIAKSMKPLLSHLSKPFVLNGYEAYAIKYRSGGNGLEGTFDKPEVNTQAIMLTSAQLSTLLAKAEELKTAWELTRTLPWLDYAQEYCDWIYPLKQMLQQTQAQVLTIALLAVGSKDTISTELFGGFFSKKPKEESTPVKKDEVPLYTVDLEKFIQSTAFTGFIENYSEVIPAYDTDLKRHIAIVSHACREIGSKFNESSVNKFVGDLNKILDMAYHRFMDENPDETDWRTIGNEVLSMAIKDVNNAKLYSKHFGMTYSNGVFFTNFKDCPNMSIKDGVVELLGSKNITEKNVTGFNVAAANDFFKAFKQIDEIPLPTRTTIDKSDFLRENPRYEDAIAMQFIEPIREVTVELFDLMDKTLFAIRNAIIK